MKPAAPFRIKRIALTTALCRGSTFVFPVVVAWRESDGWHMGGEQPWKSIAENADRKMNTDF